jgi:predicted TIM-barrel fold metal-dependent hydrolase
MANPSVTAEPPIINCHTHIFTANHVPPFLAKTYIPWPFCYLMHLGIIVALFRFWYRYPARIPYTVMFKKLVKALTGIRAFFVLLYPLDRILSIYIFILAFFLLYGLLLPVFPPEDSWLSRSINDAYVFTAPYLPTIRATWLKILVLAVVLIFFSSIRNLIFAIAKLLWKVLSKLPGPQTRDLFRRYLNIGRYAFHQKQTTILSKLRAQYPKGTGFVVLPMDMEYMDAGHPKTRYRDQMDELQKIKEANRQSLFPFVFADPRRMVAHGREKNWREGDKVYFDWDLDAENKVVLKDCFMRDYLEVHRFSGIKIYPALGYYPFDEALLPLWRYCADNGIPVLTHCIRGTIFYRGIKHQNWNAHAIFRQAMEKLPCEDKDSDDYKDDEQMEQERFTRYEPLVLSQFKNVEFSYNFTHPMNFLCLLEEEKLRELVTATIKKDPGTRLKALFGYNSENAKMNRNLENLKICFGHFGGDDEWLRYFEKDRYNYSSQLAKNPKEGIKFFKTVKDEAAPGKIEQVWKHTDWYSIICSMILQYPHVYADISYILHSDQDVLPLLKQTLQNEGLRPYVLYGTDFFVVRNHKSDKNMLADMMGGLSKEDFDQIARKNPVAFLKNTLPGEQSNLLTK